MNYSDMQVIELRQAAQNMNPGRSADVRKLKVTELRHMLVNSLSLDEALEKAGKQDKQDKKQQQPAGDLSQVIAQAVQQHIQPTVDRNEVQEMIDDAVAEAMQGKKQDLTVQIGEKVTAVGKAHKELPKLLKLLQIKKNVMLVGPAGSGKTHGCAQAADALGLDFYAMSVGPQTSKTDFYGYTDANGQYITTNFRRAFEHGGVFLIDEIDAGHAGVMTIINAATANEMVGFPDGMVKVHKDFRVIASGNTFGRGRDANYVGRQKMDAATKSRFVMLSWDYDEAFEQDICGNVAWAKKVQRIRKAAEAAKVMHVISPRASINGADMLAAGFSENEVLEMVVYQGLDRQNVLKIEERL